MTRALCACGGRCAFVVDENEWVCRACGRKGPPNRAVTTDTPVVYNAPVQTVSGTQKPGFFRRFIRRFRR